MAYIQYHSYLQQLIFNSALVQYYSKVKTN